ncbi:hypothetical protein BH23CHL5_BH23CHL5_07950 [soil metagenome]
MAKTGQEQTKAKRSAQEERRLAAQQRDRKQRMMRIAAGALAIVVVGGVLWWVAQREASVGDVVTEAAMISAPIAGRVAGDPAGTVTVVEWGDYQCPSCALFAEEATPMLIEQYVNTGLITLEYRDLAFLGTESTRAAEAAWCAQDQDRFWDFHKTIFANHDGENAGALSDGRLKAMAEVLELDTDQFNACFGNRVHEDNVRDAYDEGSAAGITSTPTLVINGEIVGYAGNEDLQARLDALLGA